MAGLDAAHVAGDVGVDDALGNALAGEVRALFDQEVVLQESWDGLE
jgi:hypothetical protein